MKDLKIFTTNIEDKALEQVNLLLEQDAFKNCKVRIMPDVHAGAGCVIGFTANLGDKVIPNVVGVDIGCLDKETEFISQYGFKKISEYKKGDLVLQYDPNTNKATFVEPLLYIKKPCTRWYHFRNSKGLDQMVSEEHRMLVYFGYKGRGYKQMVMHPKELSEKKLDKGIYSFKTTFLSDTAGVDFTDDELRLRVALCADGGIRYTKTGRKQIGFRFRKQRKIERLSSLLNALQIKYTMFTCKGGITEFYIGGLHNDLSKYNKTMDDLWGANEHQLKVISDECLYWDGNINEKTPYFSSTNKSFADFIQYAFCGSGTRANLLTQVSEKKTHNKVYTVQKTKNEYVGYYKPEIIDNVNELKYCFMVPSSFFVTRRNDKMAITGNCGVMCVKLGQIDLDLERLDKVIREYIPSGLNVHTEPIAPFKFEGLRCFNELRNLDWLSCSLGSLGGGNHFIEVDVDEEGNKYLVIHSGSRNLGKQVCEIYQDKAIKHCSFEKEMKEEINSFIKECKENGRTTEISKGIIEIKSKYNDKLKLPKDLCYIEGKDREDYLNDMEICQAFANLNRYYMAINILRKYFDSKEVRIREFIPNAFYTQDIWKYDFWYFQCIHNYINFEDNIVRKGSIAAYNSQPLLIPINMRDGVILGKGKGNSDWNYSAPHGAGRIMSRNQAREQLSMADYKESMKGIYTTSVGEETIDEAPMVYKPLEEIVANIKDNVEIEKILKPIYNFKAGE